MPAYVALEGPEGCGKSTQAARLAESLGAVLTRETGGTDVGRRLRDILHDVDVADLDDRAEALITAADRAQHVARVVAPALEGGQSVVSDRSVYSTLAYQGYGRGLDVAELQQLNDWAIVGRWPSIVVLLDAPDEVLAERMRRRHVQSLPDRFERAGWQFHRRVADGFRTMAAADPARWVVIASDAEVGHVAALVLAAVNARLDPV